MLFRFFKQSETVRMLLIALIGVVFGFITYEIIYWVNPFSSKGTISWVIAFLIGIARQHALHRYFTFQHKTSYLKSLARAYVVDIGALFFSTSLNWFLSETLQWNHRIVWACCLLSTAVISLMLLKSYIFKIPKNSI